MAKWHLDSLEEALLRRGWRVEVPLEVEWPLESGVWQLSRGAADREVRFFCFDGLGNVLPSVEESYGCFVADRPSVSLAFWRKSGGRWPGALRAFVENLE